MSEETRFGEYIAIYMRHSKFTCWLITNQCTFFLLWFQVEKAIQDYNTLAYRIGLVPSTSPYAQGVNFEIEFSPHATRPEHMISVDLRNVIKVGYMSYP